MFSLLATSIKLFDGHYRPSGKTLLYTNPDPAWPITLAGLKLFVANWSCLYVNTWASFCYNSYSRDKRIDMICSLTFPQICTRQQANSSMHIHHYSTLLQLNLTFIYTDSEYSPVPGLGYLL
ncbi:hypothetical protein SUGI_0634460 [Cryptomeria japonica]|nr:hypothetical protein SUGI_0634460 [Cryptomeria japonica]